MSASVSAATGSRLDVARVREDFPILDQMVDGRPLVYLDSAASSQKPLQVIDAIRTYYLRDHANVHRGVHELARRATEAYEESRARIARWINAADTHEIVWTRGTSEALNLVAFSIGQARVGHGDEIIVSAMEHHSNLVPWQLLAERNGAKLRFVELTDAGRLDLDQLRDMLGARTRVVALPHVSNALGTINPVREIGGIVRGRSDAVFVLDGAQGAPHLSVDVQSLGCDFYAFSGHKMCGPTGMGALWGKRTLLEEMPPYQGGGEMIEHVYRDHSTWAEVPHKFEAGTPNIAGAVAMAAAADYLDGVDRTAIHEHEQSLTRRAISLLSDIEGLRIFGPGVLEERAGVVPFVIGGTSAQDVATILDAEGIAVRAGHHCAQLVVDRFRVSATTRASFYLYNTVEEVEQLAEGVRTARNVLLG
ncbi:MAG: cysteine desulfurase [Gemmatimonadetes bacterium]|nr:cysteine desulfurase [Gemmatimonadota bacterium]MYE92441.1 cysteine desulfurase [Gemmatimonadota bacterium]MYJ11226.1 cysteine desulfurase [Gemmatimonadota bacterium]